MSQGILARYSIILWIKRSLLFLIGLAFFFALLGGALYFFSTVINTYFPTQSDFEILQISISASSAFVTLVFLSRPPLSISSNKEPTPNGTASVVGGREIFY